MSKQLQLQSRTMHESKTEVRFAMRVHIGRKRAFNVAGLLVASAVAMTMRGVAAFQSTSAPRRVHHKCHSLTQCSVVTDPSQLIRMDFPDSDDSSRRALEDIYLLASDVDGLSGELIESNPTKRVARKKVGLKKSKSYESADCLPRRSVQFRGLTTSPKRRPRKQPPPLSNSRPLSTQQGSYSPRNRSSTMPGFTEHARSDRQIAFDDGIKIVERRSGRKFVETAAAKKKRRSLSGETMYKSSAAVPESMIQFANEIHEIERITPKEEVVLGEQTQEAIRLQRIYDGLTASLDREPTDEEWCAAAGKINMEAIAQAIEDGLEAKNRLVSANLRMVQGVVNVYIRNGLRGQYNAGDLMQEGIMALIRAAEKFDPSRGFRFSTYAMYWIRSAVKRNQIFQSRVVTVPQRLYENHKRILRVQSELRESLERAPTKEELGAAVGMSEVQIDRCLSAMRQECYSLDQQIANPMKPLNVHAEQNSMYELVESQAGESNSNILARMFLREDLIETIKRHLNEEEVTLLLLRYGLSDSMPRQLKNGPLTIAEVSRIAGLKPDKVRRIINKSLKQLKVVIGQEWLDYERDLM